VFSGVWLLAFFSGACPSEEPAVIVVDRALLGCLAGELGALEAEADVLFVCAGGDLAVGVVLRPASGFSAGAGAFRHSGAFLAGYSADAYLHSSSPVYESNEIASAYIFLFVSAAEAPFEWVIICAR